MADRAKLVSVPVFLAFGEIDLAVNPLDERRHFTASDDLTIHIQAGSRHCPQLSGARHQIAETVFSWIYGRMKYVRVG